MKLSDLDHKERWLSHLALFAWIQEHQPGLLPYAEKIQPLKYRRLAEFFPNDYIKEYRYSRLTVGIRRSQFPAFFTLCLLRYRGTRETDADLARLLKVDQATIRHWNEPAEDFIFLADQETIEMFRSWDAVREFHAL